MWPYMKDYHWMSGMSGELFGDFPEVVNNIREIISEKHLPTSYIVRYILSWKYSRKGF